MDLIYSTSVGRDYLEPSTASIIHSQLELPERAANLDLGSACLGFIDGIYLAALQVEMGLIDRALVVAGENARPLLENTLATLLSPGIGLKDFFRHFASLTLGSGGAAMVVGSSEENPRAPRLRGFVSMTDPASNDLCRGDITGMETDPALLMTRGVLLAKKTFEKGRELYGWDPLGFDLIVCHQVSYANTLRFAETLSLAWDKIPLSYPQYGNMGPVAIPFTFSLAFDQGRILAGSQVALMGIGSGLTCAMLELTIP